MKLASYKSTRPGLQGLANRIIRFRLRGQYSHNEVVFEPSDGVGFLMPDGTCEEVDGAMWCVSSVAAERLPAWSPRRAGAVGGVRFKRIKLDPAHWDVIDFPVDAKYAAFRAKYSQGAMYGWRTILGYLTWLVPGQAGRVTCSQQSAYLGAFRDPWRFDPCTLHSAVEAMGSVRR